MTSKGVCAVTGATGCAGPALVRRLSEAGYRVRALARHPPPVGLFPPDVRVWVGTILDQTIVNSFVDGATYTFHLAAKAHTLSPARSFWEEYSRTNVQGTENVVRASQSSGVERLIYFSTIGVYGTRGIVARNVSDASGTPLDFLNSVDEDSPIEPQGIYAQTKRRGEEIVLDASDARIGKQWVTVLRIAAIYGPHMRGNYLRLVEKLSRGTFVPIGRGTNRKTVVHEEDVASAAHLAALHPRAGGRIYNVSDGAFHPVSEVLAAICAASGRRPPRFFIPGTLALTAASAGDGMMSLIGLRRNYTAAVKKLVEDTAVRAERIQRELGFVPQVNLFDGWSQTLTKRNSEVSEQTNIISSRPARDQ
jgi:nucleoside-diphosphate-sugar epimerase